MKRRHSKNEDKVIRSSGGDDERAHTRPDESFGEDSLKGMLSADHGG